MTEYRVAAIFTDVYDTRTYRGVTTTSLERAKDLFEAAEVYYSNPPYNKHLRSVEIQTREVSEWRTLGT